MQPPGKKLILASKKLMEKGEKNGARKGEEHIADKGEEHSARKGEEHSANKTEEHRANKGEEKRSKNKGYPKSEFESKYTRRKRDHDYTQPCTYHIILKKAPDCKPFGNVAGDPRIRPGEIGCARIDKGRLGNVIEREIFKWHEYCPFLKVYQHKVMPDHVHILVRVVEKTEKKFGFYVGQLKKRIKFKWNEREKRVMPPVFEKDFTDKIIYPSRSLEEIITYIRYNPHRLAIRKFYPDYFRRVRNIRIGEELWQAYGNILLIRNPFKEAVIVHRKDMAEGRLPAIMDFHLENIRDGGVAVSAFIAEGEKAIRDAISGAGGRMIHLQSEPFGERFKPERSRFELCSEGRLLILAPMEPLRDTSRRAECLHLNRIAEEIAKGNYSFGG